MPRERKAALPRANGVIPASHDAASARLAALVRSSADAMAGETLKGIVTDWNPAAERLFGYRAAEVIGQPLSTIVPPDRLVEAEALLARVRRGERLEGVETVRRTRDGRIIRVALTISPVWDDTGALVATTAIIREITAARANEARFQAVAAQAPAIIYTEQHATEPVVTSMSPYVETVLGIPAAAFMADHGLWLERVHPDDRDRVRAAATAEQVTVRVKDTGMGIAADALPHIFEEFRQVDSSLTRRHAGAGLGLAIAQKLAGLMGSHSTVESEAGAGSTFALRLTRARPAIGTPRGKP